MTDLPVLDAVEQRVLGCLLEKQVDRPGDVPADAERPAHGVQPDLEPRAGDGPRRAPAVETTARALRDRGLLRIVWADTGGAC